MPVSSEKFHSDVTSRPSSDLTVKVTSSLMFTEVLSLERVYFALLLPRRGTGARQQKAGHQHDFE